MFRPSEGRPHRPQRHALTSSPRLRLLLWGILALTPFSNLDVASGQAVQLEGGSSSLFQASGGSVDIHAANYDGWAGLGSLDGHVRFGAFLSRQWQGYTFGAGDHTIPLQFPTDIFDNSHYFLGRGASVTAKDQRMSVFAFAGATSTGFIAPFFRGASPEDGVGLLFFDMKLTPKLRAVSRNMFSNRQTSINGLEWQPWTWTKAAFSAGMGANQGYLASSLAADRGIHSVGRSISPHRGANSAELGNGPGEYLGNRPSQTLLRLKRWTIQFSSARGRHYGNPSGNAQPIHSERQGDEVHAQRLPIPIPGARD